MKELEEVVKYWLKDYNSFTFHQHADGTYGKILLNYTADFEDIINGESAVYSNQLGRWKKYNELSLTCIKSRMKTQLKRKDELIESLYLGENMEEIYFGIAKAEMWAIVYKKLYEKLTENNYYEGFY